LRGMHDEKSKSNDFCNGEGKSWKNRGKKDFFYEKIRAFL